MNVYDHISSNNRKTALILCAFPAALFVVIFLFSALLVEVNARSGAGYRAGPSALYYTLSIFPWATLAAALWMAFSFFGGDGVILGAARAAPITPDENRELYRLVENTAIMAGLPTPAIYLIEDESLNAFATGRKPETASVALTTGIVGKLEKSELQGVIAHELSHIGNRDTRLMMITVAGIGCFTLLGEVLLRAALRSGGRRGRGKDGGGRLILLAAALACLLFGCVIAPLLRLALSRRREYQADATAVKITRDPEALASALEKISTDPRVEVLDASPMVGNLCIANPAESGSLMNFLSGLYATHPPVEDRIAALREMAGGENF